MYFFTAHLYNTQFLECCGIMWEELALVEKRLGWVCDESPVQFFPPKCPVTCFFQMEMSPSQVSFWLGKRGLSYNLNFYFICTKREHLVLYTFLRLGRKEEEREGSVGIAAMNNLCCGSCYS